MADHNLDHAGVQAINAARADFLGTRIARTDVGDSMTGFWQQPGRFLATAEQVLAKSGQISATAGQVLASARRNPTTAGRVVISAIHQTPPEPGGRQTNGPIRSPG